MSVRLAIAGFRHGHIMSVYNQAREADDVEIVAACEEHEPTRAALTSQGVTLTHRRCEEMIATVDCDAIAVGDYYARRGPLLIAALQAGRHVIADKPICIRLDELEQIAALACSRRLSVGCQLDLRHVGKYVTLRRLLREERTIGDLHAISFNGQHPLMLGKRPGWYFEEGKQGGTLNDIAIHAIDIIPWLTGHRFARLQAARNWNARLPDIPHFRDAGQMMLSLDNGCGVLGDVSYLAPDSFGYGLPMYWRWTFWGSRGVIEIDNLRSGLQLFAEGSSDPREVAADANGPGCFRAFLQEMQGERDVSPTTAEVLASARVSLLVQDAADRNLTDVAL